MEKLHEEKEIIKLEKALGEDLVNKFRRLNKSELEFEILSLAKANEAITTAKNSDEELERAKEVVKEFSAPYREQKKSNNTKLRFISLLLAEKE